MDEDAGVGRDIHPQSMSQRLAIKRDAAGKAAWTRRSWSMETSSTGRRSSSSAWGAIWAPHRTLRYSHRKRNLCYQPISPRHSRCCPVLGRELGRSTPPSGCRIDFPHRTFRHSSQIDQRPDGLSCVTGARGTFLLILPTRSLLRHHRPPWCSVDGQAVCPGESRRSRRAR
ncbi:hypothetical protein BD626DRAFT_277441 [Schizophyllum amplum]|uniref:Uncharacterized protein n=1 Tax=Schizophyllum amplum TaxID=97359 RepID=A0A550BTD0_9AGAR|nr:hypothetical protein BD626DRAFT_277441 [Auriculariopsis ampla]